MNFQLNKFFSFMSDGFGVMSKNFSQVMKIFFPTFKKNFTFLLLDLWFSLNNFV
jgi:hypothetical protein